MFDTSKFHEREDFLVRLPTPMERGRVTTYFEAAGFAVDHDSDFAYLEREGEATPCQSSDVTQVEFLLNSVSSIPPSAIDSLNFIYLLATLPANIIPIFSLIVENCLQEFGGTLHHRGRPLDRHQLTDILYQYVEELRGELGDEPGTDFTARMVYEFAPRG